jgi:hypothetical protein
LLVCRVPLVTFRAYIKNWHQVFSFFQKNFMEENKKNNSSISQEQKDRAGNDNYKNIETAVNNPSYFDNDYAAGQEDKITKREHETEEEGRVGKS